MTEDPKRRLTEAEWQTLTRGRSRPKPALGRQHSASQAEAPFRPNLADEWRSHSRRASEDGQQTGSVWHFLLKLLIFVFLFWVLALIITVLVDPPFQPGFSSKAEERAIAAMVPNTGKNGIFGIRTGPAHLVRVRAIDRDGARGIMDGGQA